MSTLPPQRESERRLATVMFVDISGFTAMSEKMDPEELTRLMDKCFAMMETIILKYEGTIDKFIGDCVMVLFGVPRAIENADQKAVNTAIEIRNGIYKFNTANQLSIPLDIHIGINTGPVVAGTIGGKLKREFTVMGDTVNVASRLESASATGQILVGPATYHSAKHLFKFNALKPIALKGKSKPFPVYELLSRKENVLPIQHHMKQHLWTQMVGRENELALLKYHLNNVVSGKGAVINITGEAGIGKSRLITELKKMPAIKQVLLLEGRTNAMGRNLYYHPFMYLLKKWADIHEYDTREEASFKLEKTINSVFPEKADEIVPFIMRLMGFTTTARHEKMVNEIGGDALEKLVLKSIMDLLKRVSGQMPVVMVLEDLHWADNSSLRLLSAFFSLVPIRPVLFINLYRPMGSDFVYHIMDNAHQDYPDDVHTITLRPLDARQSRLLMSNLLTIRGLPKPVRNEIIQQAGGNPFFIEEVLRSFIDMGVIQAGEGVFEVTKKIDTIIIPQSINGVIMERIDQLDEETRALLRVASVIGKSFFHKILQEVIETPETIDRSLDTLKETQFIFERRRMSEMEYFFKHALARETAYDTILLQTRKVLHQKIAKAIEAVFKDRLNMFYGMLSYHYSCSEDIDNAEKYMTKAGEEALKAGASSEALHYYREALRIYLEKGDTISDPNKVAEMEKNIALSLYAKGQHAEAMVHFGNALKYYGIKEPGNPISLYTGLVISAFHLFISLYQPSLKWKMIPTDHEIELLNLYYTKAATQSSLSPIRFVIDSFYLSRMLSRFDITKIKGGFGMFVGLSLTLSWSALSFGLSRKILAFAKERMDTSDTRSLLMFKLAELMQNYYSGHEKEPYDDQLVEKGLRIGEVDHASGYLSYHGRILLEQGHFQETRRFVAKLNEVGNTYSFGFAIALKYYLNTRLLLKFRKLNAALIEAEEGINYLLRMDFKQILVTQYLSKARILILMKEIPPAKEALKEAKHIMSELPVLPPYVSSYHLTSALIKLAELETAIKAENQAEIKRCKQVTHAACKKMVTGVRRIAYDRTEAFRIMGRYLWLTGKQKAAFKWWKKSMTAGEQLGARLELARTYMEAGQYMLDTREDLRYKDHKNQLHLLSKAEAIFKELDLKWDLNALEQIQQPLQQDQLFDQPSGLAHQISM